MKIVLFQTIQFSMSTHFECKYSLIVKTFLFQGIQFSQAVLIQLIQFNISTDFVYTQLNVKTVLYFCKLHETQGSQSKFHELNIYI